MSQSVSWYGMVLAIYKGRGRSCRWSSVSPDHPGAYACAHQSRDAALTLLMFPILVTMYVRLARREEREVLAEFGETYAHYAVTTPAFFPRLGRQVEREV